MQEEITEEVQTARKFCDVKKKLKLHYMKHIICLYWHTEQKCRDEPR